MSTFLEGCRKSRMVETCDRKLVTLGQDFLFWRLVHFSFILLLVWMPCGQLVFYPTTMPSQIWRNECPQPWIKMKFFLVTTLPLSDSYNLLLLLLQRPLSFGMRVMIQMLRYEHSSLLFSVPGPVVGLCVSVLLLKMWISGEG